MSSIAEMSETVRFPSFRLLALPLHSVVITQQKQDLVIPLKSRLVMGSSLFSNFGVCLNRLDISARSLAMSFA